MKLFAFIRWLIPQKWLPRKAKIFVLHQALSTDGLARLVLNEVEVPLPIPQPRVKGFEFHSLVWETMTPSGWKPKVTISDAQFQRGATHRRWVSNVHNLNPETGHATIEVAQNDDIENGLIRTIYSWREWDLLKNVEVRVIKVSNRGSSPFEDPSGMQ